VGALGLEWVYRFGHEPRRLFKRYFVHDIPFAARLMMRSCGHRLRRSAGSEERATQPAPAPMPMRVPQQRGPASPRVTPHGR